jgi:DNA-binding response OmpR family regulator
LSCVLTSDDAEADTRDMTHPSTTPRAGRARLVLVVEDEAGIRNPLEQFLQMRGFAVVCADSVQGALDLLSARRPDAAIVDLCLKQGSGRDVIVKIPARVPVIIFSGMRAESSELERLRPRTRIVEKPYSLTMLLEQLEEMLSRSENVLSKS